MKSDKFFRMLGLAARAGGIAVGEGAVKDSIRNGNAYLVVVSEDASENTKKTIHDKCSFYNVKYTEKSDRYTLGNCIGRDFAVVLAVKNQGIAENMIEILDKRETETL